MTVTAYRLVHELALERVSDPFRPRRTTNRWNTERVQVAYASDSVALAALEMLTYWGRYASLRGYQLFSFAISEEGIEDKVTLGPAIDPFDLQATRAFGDAWATAGRSVALRVPSVVVPLGFNYLIQPGHPDFDPTAIIAHGPFAFDERIERMLERASGGAT